MKLFGLSKYHETLARIQVWLATNRKVFNVSGTSGKVFIEIFSNIYTEIQKVLFKHMNVHGWTIQRPMNKPGIASKVRRHMERCLEKAEMRRKLLDATILKCPGLATDILGISQNCQDMLEHA